MLNTFIKITTYLIIATFSLPLQADVYFSFSGSSGQYNRSCGSCGKHHQSRHSSCGYPDSRHSSPFYIPGPVVTCPTCGFHNSPSNRFCGGCKRSTRRIKSEQYCNRCNNHYDYLYQQCPSCYPEFPERHYRSKKRYRIDNNPVLLGELYQGSNDKNVFVTNVAHLTKSQSYHKVVVSVDGQGMLPILNTVKVKVNNRWMETTIGTRLSKGEQHFAIFVPQYATEILCSFKHGKGSSVTLWME